MRRSTVLSLPLQLVFPEMSVSHVSVGQMSVGEAVFDRKTGDPQFLKPLNSFNPLDVESR
jgi:hypothetical protein